MLTVTAYHARQKGWAMPENLYRWNTNAVLRILERLNGMLKARSRTIKISVSYTHLDVYKRQADITYGTNNEFGFDYLRDNMVIYKEQLTQSCLLYTSRCV